MFEGLRTRLRNIQGKLEASIEEAAVPGNEAAAPQKVPANTAGATGEKSPTLISKVKVLITDREFIVDEKDLQDTLFELEMVLLENDVALPVTDEIISHVRSDLTGKRRKIGESVDQIVLEALSDALLNVLGKGFDLTGYNQITRPAVKSFSPRDWTGKTTTSQDRAVPEEERISQLSSRRGHVPWPAPSSRRRARKRLGITILQHHGWGPVS